MPYGNGKANHQETLSATENGDLPTTGDDDKRNTWA
jgi:hypothetical protein